MNKHILLGVCGGIAAYKSAELVRLLRKQGCDVRVVMTGSAQQFVSPLTFQALSGNAVHTEILDAETENAMDHISLARWADALIIAPATANVIAKCCHGLADDLLTTIYLAATCPVYIAPAMNQAMWNKAATQENMKTIRRHGVQVIGPGQGDQACGETGLGRMSEPSEICAVLLAEPAEQSLGGLRVLISAGPTREPLDPVRYITNRSSGKMGYALAEAARNAGATVTLVSGPVQLPPPPADVEIVRVETAAEMYDAVIARAEQHDIYIGAAAVADYTPAVMQLEKIKKHGEQTTLILQKTRDILAEVADLTNRPFTVGFAAETTDLEVYALDKLARKNLDMIAANWVGREQGGFDSEQNALEVFWKDGRKVLAMTGKKRLAEQLIELIAKRLKAEKIVIRKGDKIMPTCWILAGPNGVGKTTFALEYLPRVVNCYNYINADLIAAGLSPLAQERELIAASRIFLHEIETCIEKCKDFAFETTLAGRSYLKLINRLHHIGWRIELIYLALPAIDVSEARVAERVKHGGHGIPKMAIERRFARSLHNLFTEFSWSADSCLCFMNIGDEPILIFEQQNKKRIVIHDTFYQHLLKEAGL